MMDDLPPYITADSVLEPTAPSEVSGTVVPMSPRQRVGEFVRSRAMVYVLGAILVVGGVAGTYNAPYGIKADYKRFRPEVSVLIQLMNAALSPIPAVVTQIQQHGIDPLATSVINSTVGPAEPTGHTTQPAPSSHSTTSHNSNSTSQSNGASANVPPLPPKPSVPPTLNSFSYLRGVNVYSLEFSRNDPTIPKNQLGEPASSYSFLASRGVKIVRLAIPWTLLQPVPAGTPTAGTIQAGLNAPMDQAGFNVVRGEVDKMEAVGISPIIDLHNGCGYPQGPNTPPPYEVYCGNGISVAQETAIWTTLALKFKDDHMIAAYDIMNEPKSSNLSLATYKQYSQAVVNAIRATGDTHRIWVESMTVNQTLAGNVTDGPWITSGNGAIDHTIVYSEHFYPTGITANNIPYDTTSDYGNYLRSVQAFGNWCNTWQVHCSIGETSWPNAASQTQWPGSSARWDALGEAFYQIADAYKFDVTYFNASSVQQGRMSVYDNSVAAGQPATGINNAESSALVIERHLSH